VDLVDGGDDEQFLAVARGLDDRPAGGDLGGLGASVDDRAVVDGALGGRKRRDRRDDQVDWR
jgi:hypothetical protein